MSGLRPLDPSRLADGRWRHARVNAPEQFRKFTISSDPEPVNWCVDRKQLGPGKWAVLTEITPGKLAQITPQIVRLIIMFCKKGFLFWREYDYEISNFWREYEYEISNFCISGENMNEYEISNWQALLTLLSVSGDLKEIWGGHASFW